jgi:hypothetical protein
VFDELRGREALAVAVDMCAQPAEKGAEIAARDLRVESAYVARGGVDELGAVDVA